jgi:UDP-N-acetylglucosamine 4,6-dehydratase/5-epimerase
MNIFNKKTILITGGTGSFGSAFVKYLLDNHSQLSRIIIFSRDELKQYNLSQENLNHKNYSKLRFFLGDIRDKTRLVSALNDVDIVVHAAALKQVEASEYNPIEFIKTNIIGSQNLVEACLETKVNKVIALSTDKAAAAINLYGATKLCSDKLFLASNNITGKKNIRFSVVRYGNVINSRGSVVPNFLKQKLDGVLKVTNPEMTRFSLTLREGIENVMWALKNGIGGEVIVPKIPSYKILDLAKAVDDKIKIKIIGTRQGEKIHEEMITISDGKNTLDIGSHYIIVNNKKVKEKYIKKFKGKKVADSFSYRSNLKNNFLTISELRKIIKKETKNVD